MSVSLANTAPVLAISSISAGVHKQPAVLSSSAPVLGYSLSSLQGGYSMSNFLIAKAGKARHCPEDRGTPFPGRAPSHQAASGIVSEPAASAVSQPSEKARAGDGPADRPLLMAPVAATSCTSYSSSSACSSTPIASTTTPPFVEQVPGPSSPFAANSTCTQTSLQSLATLPFAGQPSGTPSPCTLPCTAPTSSSSSTPGLPFAACAPPPPETLPFAGRTSPFARAPKALRAGLPQSVAFPPSPRIPTSTASVPFAGAGMPQHDAAEGSPDVPCHNAPVVKNDQSRAPAGRSSVALDPEQPIASALIDRLGVAAR